MCTRSVVVAAAMKLSATNGSSVGCPDLSSQLFGGAGWSVTKTASMPRASARRARSASTSRSSDRPTGMDTEVNGLADCTR